MSEEETREQIEEITDNAEEPVKEEEHVKEAVIETIIEEEVKPKPKSRASRAKPKIKIIKESGEPVVEPIVETVEPEIEEKPKQIYKLKEIVKCPDCNMDMTAHTLKYIHKRRGFCKANIKASPEPEKPVPEPVAQQKPKITQDIVNDYIKENQDIVNNHL